jgi:heptosyltransferase II
VRREEKKKILVRSPNWVGDALMTTPAVHCLKTHFPDSHISVLAKPWVIPIFEANPDVDQMIIYQKPGIHQGIKGRWILAQEINRGAYDVAVNFPHSLDSAWIFFLSRIPKRIGYASEGRGVMLTDRLRINSARKEEHQVPFFFHLLEPLGIRETARPEKNPMLLQPDRHYQEQAEARLQALGVGPSDFLVGLAPGAVYGSAKCWPFDRFEWLAERLIKDWPAKVIFLGSQSDTLAGFFTQNTPVHNLLGMTPLGEALALIQKCRLMICNDSGLMHAAAALNIPLVALFGSTNLDRTGPWGGISRVIKKDFPCSPCLKKVCGEPRTCMEAISVDEVWETLHTMKSQGIWA